MKKFIKASTTPQKAGEILLNCLTEYIGSGLAVDVLQLQKYPSDQWAQKTKELYKDQVDSNVYEFFEENFEGWFVDQADDIANAVWYKLENDPDFMLDMEE